MRFLLQLMEHEVTASQLKGQLESTTQQAEEFKVSEYVFLGSLFHLRICGNRKTNAELKRCL